MSTCRKICFADERSQEEELRNNQKLICTLVLALGASAGVLSSSAQDADHQDQHGQEPRAQEQGQRRSDNPNDQAQRPAYQEGAKHAQEDVANKRQKNYRGQYDNDLDRSAYQAGYDQVYGQENRNQNGRTSDGRYDNSQNAQRNDRYRFDGHPNSSENIAERNGLRDGTTDGESDRRSRHRSRAAQTSNYRNALRGYGSGDKNQYRIIYRQSYQRGYQQAYNGNGYYGQR